MHGFTYEKTLAASQRAPWRIEDIIGADKPLDFAKPFLPEALARTDGMIFLKPSERTVLNQIRGHNYLAIFGLVEEFILPFVLDHARPHLSGDDARVRALLQFAGEEAKHIDLFRRFRAEFEKGFGTECEVIGPPEAIAGAVLKHKPLSVALLILHLEWMTQRHYIECIRDDQGLDRQFASMLKHHWMEECQHAQLDTLMVHAIAEACDADEIGRAVDGYLALGGMIDGALGQQVAFDLASFQEATGRTLDEEERAWFAEEQTKAMRWTFLGSGMTHPAFTATLGRISPAARDRIAGIAPAFC
jgi:hypothetical protein